MINDKQAIFRNKLSKYLPEEALNYCSHLWLKYPFHLYIKRPRKTKLGDYRYDPKQRQHFITLNSNLNPYAFLVTYLHEVAHLITFQKYGRKAQPHGNEWKAVFSHLLEPVTRRKMVPDDIMGALTRYMENPKASSCSDPNLMIALGRHDHRPKIYLKDIAEGELFNFHDRIFRKGNLRRTRYVCAEIHTGRNYLISKHAEIIKKED